MPALVAAVRVELEGEDCVVTMIRDLTAAKQASRALAENEAAQRAIFDLSPDAISVADALDGRYVAVNAEFLRLGSHILEETIGKSDLELGVWAKPSDRERFSATLVSQGQVRNLEVDFLRHDRTIVPTLISAALIDYRHQPCVVAYIRDITPRKQIERDLLSAREELSRQVKALSDSEETFRKLFDANLDSMTLTGIDGNYIDVNQEFTKATGFSRAEAIGHHFADLNMWIHPDEMIAFGDQLSKTNEVRNLEVTFRMKDGAEQPVLLSAVNLELHGTALLPDNFARNLRPQDDPARAGRGARGGAGGVARQVGIPVEHVARDSHADELDSRNGRSADGNRARRRAAKIFEHRYQQRPCAARIDQRHPRSRQGRERADQPRGGRVRPQGRHREGARDAGDSRARKRPRADGAIRARDSRSRARRSVAGSARS